jgi:hypothetical protein
VEVAAGPVVAEDLEVLVAVAPAVEVQAEAGKKTKVIM